MIWRQITFALSGADVTRYSLALEALGADAITLQDSQDDAIFEPALGENIYWPHTKLTALFAEHKKIDWLLQQLQLDLALEELPPYQLSQLTDDDWEKKWMEYFKPLNCGHNVWICPSWCEPPQPNATNVRLDPGLAFGTGTHATTFLCLQYLSEHQPKNKIVLDYGCGSGILAVTAAKLGALTVDATDISEQALDATLANAKLNNVDVVCSRPDELTLNNCDLLLANILINPLLELAPQLADYVKPQGHIILSGILQSQLPLLIEHYCQWFDVIEQRHHQDWCLLVAKKRI